MAGISPGIEEAAGRSMQDSWVDVPQGKEGVGEGEEREVGSLTHSRSQQEMEKLLASAASDDEGSEHGTTSVPTFTIPEQSTESGIQKVSRVIRTGQRHMPSATTERLQSGSRILGLRVSWLFEGGMANLLFPVLVLTHLALFGLGFYIGRRTSLVKA